MNRPLKKNKTSPKIYIGTSGWSYEHWKDNFYPKGLKSNEWINFYSTQFSTVEINTTFYHLPLKSTIQKWCSNVPKDFLFSIKASQYITHLKRLKDCKNSVKLFYKVIKDLKCKTGPILFQLPPSFKYNKERLTEFIKLLRDDYQYVFEFRHESWFVEEIYELLNKNKIALCITDLNGHLSPEELTTSFTYIRLHGPHTAYTGSYGTAKLKAWKRKIKKWTSLGISVYCYFDNDDKGYAIQDALTLEELL